MGEVEERGEKGRELPKAGGEERRKEGLKRMT